MKYALFSDESGTSPDNKCFTIGCLLIPIEELEKTRAQIHQLLAKYNLPQDRELKWTKLKNNYGVINFLIDVVHLIFQSKISFICKVTWKAKYRYWLKNEEDAFYRSYTMLMKYCVDCLNAEVIASIDDKSDSYSKNHEVVQTIVNYQIDGEGEIIVFEKKDSKEEILIQVADLITGLVNASHNLWLNDNQSPIHCGKLLAISKVAACLGWDHVHYDTYPNANFNIWHFPKEEYRAVPSTESIVHNTDITKVTPEEIIDLQSSE